jgi:2-polyprenyl-3-methyl-5-hydroxy-6-metoxy-1,4-benzoquinol methylase
VNDTLMQKPYEACPLCNNDLPPTSVETGDATRHKLYQGWMRDTIEWVSCVLCQHVYSKYHFTEAGFAKLFDKPALESEQPARRDARERLVMGRFLERTHLILPPPYPMGTSEFRPRWLDVGSGNGALVATGEEYGYEMYGLDARPSAVEELGKQGYRGVCTKLEHYKPADTKAYHIVSMLDVLEHMVDPVRALRHVLNNLLASYGHLIVSAPNSDCYDWRAMGKDNPYWREVEHFHNFSRSRLMALLREEGFTILRYHVSERYTAGMEIIAQAASWRSRG